jgi:hypothetical protein
MAPDLSPAAQATIAATSSVVLRDPTHFLCVSPIAALSSAKLRERSPARKQQLAFCQSIYSRVPIDTASKG